VLLWLVFFLSFAACCASLSTHPRRQVTLKPRETVELQLWSKGGWAAPSARRPGERVHRVRGTLRPGVVLPTGGGGGRGKEDDASCVDHLRAGPAALVAGDERSAFFQDGLLAAPAPEVLSLPTPTSPVDAGRPCTSTHSRRDSFFFGRIRFCRSAASSLDRLTAGGGPPR